MNTPLKIDSEYESLCPPLTAEEYQQLEDNIVSEGEILMPLIVWDDVIIDGHNRYKIAQAHPEVNYAIRDKAFANRYEAVAWICKNQLGRRNLSPQQKKYLIGKRYEAEKNANGGDRKSDRVKSVGTFDPLISTHGTRSKIANETNTTESYVKHAESFAKGVDAAEMELPGVKNEIFAGTIKPTAGSVAAIAKAPPQERRQLAEELRKPKTKPQQDASARAAVRQELKEVRAIYEDMLAVSAPTGEDAVLDTLHGAVTDMIRVCETLFTDFPRLLQDSAYKMKVIEIMQEPKSYILKLEGEEK